MVVEYILLDRAGLALLDWEDDTMVFCRDLYSNVYIGWLLELRDWENRLGDRIRLYDS